METAVYCRVSTDEQAQEGYSIRGQVEKLKSYISAKSWSVYDVYLDEGISGKNITERPAINRMIEDIVKGNVKNVLVFKLDRLTRSVADLVQLIDLFKVYGCAFNSLTESIDTSTASGRMFLKIIGIFSEFERENIGERIRLGKERKAKEGWTTAAPNVSYGYDRDKGEKIQRVNEEEAEIVRRVFDMYVHQNMSLRQIACTFNQEGITRKKGNPWTTWMVGSCLQNCNYAGRVRYSILDQERYFETEGKHDAIISEELFEQAQQLMAKTKAAAPTKRPTEKNYFLGFLYCGICGHRMKSHIIHDNRKIEEKRKPHHNFECMDRIIKACDSKRVAASKVEAAVIEYISNIPIVAVNAEEEEQARREAAARVEVLQRKITALDAKEKEMLDSYLEDILPLPQYRDVKIQIDGEREKLQAEIERLTVVEDTIEPKTKQEIISAFIAGWGSFTDIEKRQFLLKHIRKITVINHKVEGKYQGRCEVLDIEFTA
jgi:site-specific DNA recombinase